MIMFSGNDPYQIIPGTSNRGRGDVTYISGRVSTEEVCFPTGACHGKAITTEMRIQSKSTEDALAIYVTSRIIRNYLFQRDMELQPFAFKTLDILNYFV